LKCRICGATRGFRAFMWKHFEEEHSVSAQENMEDKIERVEVSPVWQDLPSS